MREDRVFVRGGRRHHRPKYSATEFRVGVGVVGLLALIVGWVAWRGQHPDPELFTAGENLLEPAQVAIGSSAASAERGPLPEALAAAGWSEGAISTFGWDNLYEKIDGREGYYKSLGFERLWFVTLSLERDPSVSVDVEMYDLGKAGNALGAYAGERPRGGRPEVGSEGLAHLDRNALCMTRGAFYIRAIGSDETPIVRSQLEHLREALERGVAGEPLPWAYGLFVGTLGCAPEQVSYMAENAFSFGFANDVYAARLEDDTELFVVALDTPQEAEALADRFNEGFRGYGSAIEASIGVSWTQDRYIQTVAGAKSAGRWTVGVRGAPDREGAESALKRIEEAVLRFR